MQHPLASITPCCSCCRIVKLNFTHCCYVALCDTSSFRIILVIVWRCVLLAAESLRSTLLNAEDLSSGYWTPRTRIVSYKDVVRSPAPTSLPATCTIRSCDFNCSVAALLSMHRRSASAPAHGSLLYQSWTGSLDSASISEVLLGSASPFVAPANRCDSAPGMSNAPSVAYQASSSPLWTCRMPLLQMQSRIFEAGVLMTGVDLSEAEHTIRSPTTATTKSSSIGFYLEASNSWPE